MFGRVICVIKKKAFPPPVCECFIAVMHYKVRAKTSIPAVILWCKWTAVTTSKLCPDYNLAVLTSFVQEKKKKLVESFSVKAAVCNFPPRGIKVNSEFLPQHLSLTLMSCLSWNSTLPGAKITHIPPSCHRRRRSRCQTEKEGGKKKKKAKLMFSVFLNWFCLLQDKLHTEFCHCCGCCCGSSWQGQPQPDCTHRQRDSNVQNIIEKSDKQALEYTGSVAQTRCCVWITVGWLVCSRSRTRLEARLKAELAVF